MTYVLITLGKRRVHCLTPVQKGWEGRKGIKDNFASAPPHRVVLSRLSHGQPFLG